MVAKKATKAEKTVDLHDKLAGLRKDLSDAKRSLAANELPNPRVIMQTRRDVARTLTAINAERKVKEQGNA